MIRERELLVIKDTPSRTTPGAGVKLRVVQWISSDGISTTVEKRGYYTKDGVIMPGKSPQGLTYEDVVALVNMWKPFLKMLKTPPPVPAQDPQRRGDDPVPF